jgi:hypothetical protein
MSLISLFLALFISANAIRIAFGDNTIASDKPTSRSAVVADADTAFKLYLFVEGDSLVSGKGQFFVVRVVNNTRKKITVLDVADVQMFCGEARNLLPASQIVPKKAYGDSPHVMNIRLEIKCKLKPQATGTFLTGRNGMIDVDQIWPSTDGFIGIPVTAAAMATPGTYDLVAILLDGNTEMSRSDLHQIVIARH